MYKGSIRCNIVVLLIVAAVPLYILDDMGITDRPSYKIQYEEVM